MTIKDAICSVLIQDAKIPDIGHLGYLLGHTELAPYGIYFMNPPEVPKFPLITHYGISASGHIPRITAFNFTVWSGNYDEIHNRIYDLLHRKPLGTTSDVGNVALLWNWLGPELFDQNYEVYVRAARYSHYGVK